MQITDERLRLLYWCAWQQGSAMRTYEDLAELARICMRQARETKSRAVAAELRRMAKDYQRRAADLEGGKLPDSGERAHGSRRAP